mmetsp:Transcript_5720/g.22430  ORF Transcript_5720/g.22430 Transcript_5720/m.22430 type:complete len:200 (-) Transcript_5720:367-966(-)
MDGAQQETTSQPSLCVGGCGFFGSSETGNMCSKCWREEVSRNRAEADSRAAPARVAEEATGPVAGESMSVAEAEPSVEFCPVVPTEAAQAAQEPPAEADADADADAAAPREPSPEAAREAKRAAVVVSSAPKKKKKNRCAVCDKKLGLTAIKCRCEGFFCSAHRYPECHNCAFDFKKAERAVLAETVTGGGQFERITKI